MYAFLRHGDGIGKAFYMRNLEDYYSSFCADLAAYEIQGNPKFNKVIWISMFQPLELSRKVPFNLTQISYCMEV